MIRYLHSFTEPCGCTYAEGRWYNCSAHPRDCDVCEVPITIADAERVGLCTECLDLFDRDRAWELKTSVA